MINKERLIRLAQKLIRINSENPPGHEQAIADLIARDMRDAGLSVKVVSFAKGRPNVIATLAGTQGTDRRNAKRKALLITPHIDTVPAGKGWRHPPFSAQIIGKKLYGRGASDDKGNLACAMEALRSLVEDKVRLNYDVIFAATADEETGSRLGILPLLEKDVLRPEVALILDSDEFSSIVAQKGLIHGRVQIFGKKAHGAYNWRGVNAIEIASGVIADLKVLKLSFRKHARLRPPTINIGTIKGGDKVNMVADFCEFSFDLRFLPGMDPQRILRTIKTIVARRAKKFTISVDDLQEPYEIAAAHPLVKTFVGACRREGVKSELKGSEGATVITFFQKKRIPAFATGFGSQGTAHANDEYAEVEKLFRGAKVLERFLKEWK